MQSITTTRVGPKESARSFGVNHYKEAYRLGVNVSQLLERQDPTVEYAEGSDDRKLDAFERVMREAGLITNPIPDYGIQASTWEEATQTAEHRALLHEFCSRVWRQTSGTAPRTPVTSGLVDQGQRAVLLAGDPGVNTLVAPYVDDRELRAKRLAPPIPLAEIVARTTAIDRPDYRSVYIIDDLNTDAYRYKRVNEGTEIPATTVVTGEHTLRLQKYGRLLRATYEQLRRLTLDRIAFIIARMQLQAEVDKVSDGMNTVINGDGNANTSAAVLTQTGLDVGSAAGTLTLKAWLTYKSRFGPGYVLDTVLAQEAPDIALQLLPVNTVNGLPLALLPSGAFGSLRPITDLLSGGVRHGLTSDAPTLKLVGWDSRFALELVTEIGGNVSEVERFVTNQTQVLTMTEVMAFGILDPFSTRVLNINA